MNSAWKLRPRKLGNLPKSDSESLKEQELNPELLSPSSLLQPQYYHSSHGPQSWGDHSDDGQLLVSRYMETGITLARGKLGSCLGWQISGQSITVWSTEV